MKGGDKVLYSASHRPPDAVVDAIAACGARLEVGSALTPLPRARESADVLVDRAMRTLAANAGASDLDLAALEKKLLQRRPKKEKNEVEYWKRVCVLAAAAGEAMRGALGGRWKVNADGDLGIAFAVTRPDRAGFVNLIGRARASIDEGVSASAAALVAMLVAPTPKRAAISLLENGLVEYAAATSVQILYTVKDAMPAPPALSATMLVVLLGAFTIAACGSDAASSSSGAAPEQDAGATGPGSSSAKPAFARSSTFSRPPSLPVSSLQTRRSSTSGGTGRMATVSSVWPRPAEPWEPCIPRDPDSGSSTCVSMAPRSTGRTAT